jgi:hypothetical protein
MSSKLCLEPYNIHGPSNSISQNGPTVLHAYFESEDKHRTSIQYLVHLCVIGTLTIIRTPVSVLLRNPAANENNKTEVMFDIDFK